MGYAHVSNINRPEDTIKNLMKAEKADQDRRGFVKSDIKYPGGSTNAWMEREAYTWLAPKLSYVFTFKSEKNIVSRILTFWSAALIIIISRALMEVSRSTHSKESSL
jgi:hypothetical protein